MRPPVESIELYLNAEIEQAVRVWWQMLADVRVSSMAHGEHTPHITLLAAPHTGGSMLAAARANTSWCDGLLGASITLSGLGLFPGGRSVLYASLVPTAQLLESHAALWQQLDRAGIEVFSTAAPQSWTPHCTLAKRLRSEDVGAACAQLIHVPWPVHGHVSRVIHWDGAARVVNEIASI